MRAVTYTKPGAIEITYSNGITQRFSLHPPNKDKADDKLIVHHTHTARYL